MWTIECQVGDLCRDSTPLTSRGRLNDGLSKFKPLAILAFPDMASIDHVLVEVSCEYKGRGESEIADERVYSMLAFVYLAADFALGDLQRTRQRTPDEAFYSGAQSRPGSIFPLLLFTGGIL